VTFSDMDELLAAAQRGEVISEAERQRLLRKQHLQRLTAAAVGFRDGERDWDSLRRHMMGIGRNELPGLLSLFWDGLPREQPIKALGDAWVTCEYPEQAMPRREWLPIFRSAGYHDEESPAAAPDRITLWRGGILRCGMSWTADRDRAEWFQHRFDHPGTVGRLWTITVGPDRLLAHYHTQHRSEDEYVIDSTGIRPHEVQPPPTLRGDERCR